MRPGACILTSPSEGAGASSHHCLGVGGSGFTLLVTTHLQLRSAKGYHARTLALPQPRPGNILRNGAAGGGGRGGRGTEVLSQALPGWEGNVLWGDGARASLKLPPSGVTDQPRLHTWGLHPPVIHTPTQGEGSNPTRGPVVPTTPWGGSHCPHVTDEQTAQSLQLLTRGWHAQLRPKP